VFVRNQWYAAAEADELGAGPVGRIFLGEPVVMYRTPDGTPVALEDRCCHRRAPLSKGKVEGANLRCGYHGFLYDASGRVVWVPGQDKVPPGAQVKTYPLVERYGLVWIWMGDPARRDDSLIPEAFRWNVAPGWVSTGARLPVAANHMLLVDNLMDLSHVPFLHAATIGSANDTDPDLTWERGPSWVRGTRIGRNLIPTARARALGVNSNMDVTKVMTFTPASNVSIEITQNETGLKPRETPRWCFHSFILNAMTPETETSCHYFWRSTRDYDVDSAETTALIFKSTTVAFNEDKDMLEAEQKTIDLAPRAPQIDVMGDTGGLQARRIVERLLAGEQSPRAAAE
jgi:phenylpropionate dioxygenase-like ring-hydroxylating dioxygenase large terminal subunit